MGGSGETADTHETKRFAVADQAGMELGKSPIFCKPTTLSELHDPKPMDVVTDSCHPVSTENDVATCLEWPASTEMASPSSGADENCTSLIGIWRDSTGSPRDLCVVCGDRGSGFHYNAYTCEGCKGDNCTSLFF